MDKRQNESMHLSRRSFVGKLARWSLFSVVAASGMVIIRALIPGSSRFNSLVKLGNYNDFPIGEFTFLRDHNIYVFRDHNGIKVVSAICTHLGCTVEKSDGGFLCPCHGSSYNSQGQVLSGAAMKNLSWYRTYVREGGVLLTDLNNVVGPDEVLRIS
jgi:cytochrome b6-f complex iron-sulfur subunit